MVIGYRARGGLMETRRLIYFCVACLLLAVIASDLTPLLSWEYASVATSIDIDV
jgi:hypothetical protein